MHIKIYFADKPLFLCDELNAEISAFTHHDDAVFIDEFSTAAVNSMLFEMRQEQIKAGIFRHPDLPALKKAFWRKFVLVEAGGGLVENEKGEVLFMYRRNKWDLPKGKLDKGETLEECALREVKEETGLAEVSLGRFLLHTYHSYEENGKHLLKDTSWWQMRADSVQTLEPQASEQIAELRWVGADQFGSVLGNTYPAIVDVLKAGGYSPA